MLASIVPFAVLTSMRKVVHVEAMGNAWRLVVEQHAHVRRVSWVTDVSSIVLGIEPAELAQLLDSAL
jgi:hypothetical protein